MSHFPIRVYADTSVFGGAFEPEFARGSKMFFDQVKSKRIELISSIAVVNELEDAPPAVRLHFKNVVRTENVLPISRLSIVLANEYLKLDVVTEKHFTDAIHVAISTTANVRAIVSWNFKHIVHIDKIEKYNAVNRLYGYNPIWICTPFEVLRNEEDR